MRGIPSTARGGRCGRLWGRSYRHQASDNILTIAMIENPPCAGKYLTGPSAWKDTPEGYRFFEGLPAETSRSRTGAWRSLGGDRSPSLPYGVVPIEGSEDL